MLLTTLPCPAKTPVTQLASLFDTAREGGTFSPMSPPDQTRMTRLVTRMLKQGFNRDLADKWSKLGFDTVRIPLEGRTLVAVSEQADRKEGRGWYLFGTPPGNGNLLMIPHSFYDYHTADIALHLMAEGRYAAACFNTVHRFGDRRGGNNRSSTHKNRHGSEPVTWDMAKQPNTAFAAWTRAVTVVYPEAKLFQLHGFTAEKRKTAAGRQADMILSNGTRTPSFFMAWLRNCLQSRLPGRFFLYPYDVKELGGTKNVIGDLMHALGHPGFLHVEMSRDLRDQLRGDETARRIWITCTDRN